MKLKLALAAVASIAISAATAAPSCCPSAKKSDKTAAKAKAAETVQPVAAKAAATLQAGKAFAAKEAKQCDSVKDCAIKAANCPPNLCDKDGKLKKNTLGTKDLKALLDAKAPIVLLDARSGKWDDGRRIAGATQLSSSATAEQASAAIPGKDALVVTYCSGTQCPAGKKLAGRLGELGYKNVVVYSDGIAGWFPKQTATQ